MPRRPSRRRDRAAESHDDILDREALVAFVRDSKRPVTLRDIQRALGLRSADRRRLQDALNELAGDGLVERVRGKIYRARQDLPEVAVLDIAGLDIDLDGPALFARIRF